MNFVSFVIFFKIKICILNKTLLEILNKIFFVLFNHIIFQYIEYWRNEYDNNNKNKLLNIKHTQIVHKNAAFSVVSVLAYFYAFYDYKMTSRQT